MTHDKKVQPMTDLEQAKYDLIHDHPRGAEGLGPIVNMNPGTLSNKVHPLITSHHLSVDEAVQIQLVRQQYPVFEAEARLFGFVTIPAPALDDVSDMDLLEAWANWHADIGETGQEIKKCLSERRVTRHALDRVRREVFEDFKCELELLKRLETLCDD